MPFLNAIASTPYYIGVKEYFSGAYCPDRYRKCSISRLKNARRRVIGACPRYCARLPKVGLQRRIE